MEKRKAGTRSCRGRNIMKFYACILALLSLIGCSGTRPSIVGEGVLGDCPKTPNCVNSLAKPPDSVHAIAPLKYTGTKMETMAILMAVVDSLPRTMLVAQTDNYVYFEFTSLVWRFVDDVEFVFDEANKLIHFRSASRLGKGDLGVNRKRMENIRELFQKKIGSASADPAAPAQGEAEPENEPEEKDSIEQSE